MPLSLAQILAVLDDPRSTRDLKRYFLATGADAFTGGQFEMLGGGGDRPETANVVTAEDLVAVGLLSVRIHPRTVLDLLQGRLGEQVSAELSGIPVDVDLGTEAATRLITDGGHAVEAWRLLRHTDDTGWVTAGKLLARKRPRLVPVYDRVVRCAYGTGAGFWEWLHGKLQEDGGTLAERLDALHAEVGLPPAVQRLRVLDVVFWMRHRRVHLAARCPGLELP
ncbi:DUF6308 family protein [Micromonospora sp. SH-82]|uniref:DUF6308 family protein n=1 Tax=Micromonospora sp. SH-82 TaxID=3132938 RepID=UPI003EB7D1B0